jgi:ribosomal protein L20
LLEKWLALALEYNPKQRGFVFERGANEPLDPATGVDKPKVKFVDEIGKGPQQVLKVFTALDEALKRKFLTFFCLHTYKSFELEIDATTTMADLFAAVERATGVRRAECELVLPLHQKNEVITATTKPLDLFIADCHDRPMLFVGRAGKLLAEAKPNVSASIQEVLRDVKTKLRPHFLKRFVSDSYFLVREEQKKYSTLLDGLKNNGVRMNDVILRQKLEVQRMLKLCWGLNGSLELFVITLSQTKEKIEDRKVEC